MIDEIVPAIGAVAAVLTSLSYILQVRKTCRRQSTHDLSLHMLGSLTLGLTFWATYGYFRGDWVIVIANLVGASLSGGVLAFKVRDIFRW